MLHKTVSNSTPRNSWESLTRRRMELDNLVTCVAQQCH
jgi:hypothetical protein